MDKFKVGIVLVNYNVFEDTIACVESILNSSIKSLFIVIVDNNSKNKNLLYKLKSHSKNIHLIFNSKNQGFGKANNIGIDWILNNIFTNYIFLLNNDTIINKNSIYNLVNSFPNEVDTVMVTPKILTYESPIEFVYDNIVKTSCIVSQSEIPRHIPSFDAGIRNALRRKPRLILVGECRDKESPQRSIGLIG